MTECYSAKNKKFVGTNIPTPVFVNNLILAKFVDMTTIKYILCELVNKKALEKINCVTDNISTSWHIGKMDTLTYLIFFTLPIIAYGLNENISERALPTMAVVR